MKKILSLILIALIPAATIADTELALATKASLFPLQIETVKQIIKAAEIQITLDKTTKVSEKVLAKYQAMTNEWQNLPALAGIFGVTAGAEIPGLPDKISSIQNLLNQIVKSSTTTGNSFTNSSKTLGLETVAAWSSQTAKKSYEKVILPVWGAMKFLSSGEGKKWFYGISVTLSLSSLSFGYLHLNISDDGVHSQKMQTLLGYDNQFSAALENNIKTYADFFGLNTDEGRILKSAVENEIISASIKNKFDDGKLNIDLTKLMLKEGFITPEQKMCTDNLINVSDKLQTENPELEMSDIKKLAFSGMALIAASAILETMAAETSIPSTQKDEIYKMLDTSNVSLKEASVNLGL